MHNAQLPPPPSPSSLQLGSGRRARLVFGARALLAADEEREIDFAKRERGRGNQSSSL